MFETGFVVFLGVLLLLAKLPRRWMLRALNHGLAIDVVVSASVLILHWGTFSGLMAATFAGVLTSFATTGARRLFGYIDGKRYYPGYFRLDLS